MNESPGIILGRKWVAWGSISAFVAVAAGAFGAHALRSRIPDSSLQVFQTAAHYHLIHSVVIVALGILMGQLDEPRRTLLSARLLLSGILVFSGSLYLLALSGMRVFGAITPIGGICFLAGWALLASWALAGKD